MTRLTCNYLLQSSIRSRRRNFESMGELHDFIFYVHVLTTTHFSPAYIRIVGKIAGGTVCYWIFVWLLRHIQCSYWGFGAANPLQFLRHQHKRFDEVFGINFHLDEKSNCEKHFSISRTVVMVVVSVVCIIPLSLLRNMESLSHVSTISIIFYFCMVLKVEIIVVRRLGPLSHL